MQSSDSPSDSQWNAPAEDIQHALQAAAQGAGEEATALAPQLEMRSATVAAEKPDAKNGLRWAILRCGLVAEKYPWQTTGLLAAAIGCGYVCSYFGFTVLAGLVLYALSTDD